jgi:hypothetical protein
MFNSTVLEVGIGLVFCFASVSLMVSQISELIASVLKLRANTLLTGIKGLLNDRNFSNLAKDVYNHALVNPRSAGVAQNEKELTDKPSYIPSSQFAIALVDSLQTMPGDWAKLGESIGSIKDKQLQHMLHGMYVRAGGSIEKLHGEVAAWFDNGMQRVAGEYKRRSQIVCLIIAFAIAALFNIDSFHLVHSLWQHPSITAFINGNASTETAATLLALDKLPIGWMPGDLRYTSWYGWVYMAFGWIVTASSTVFGAPFWFDLLQRLTRLRGTGKKPDEIAQK